MNKYNDPGFKYEEFYKEQQRDGIGYLSNAPIKETAQDFADKEEVDQKRKDNQFYESLKSGGQGWSKIYTDEQLKKILGKLSIAKEKERRKGLVSQAFDFQFYFGGGLNLVNNENLEDSQTTEQSKYDIEASIEGYGIQAFQNFRKMPNPQLVR